MSICFSVCVACFICVVICVFSVFLFAIAILIWLQCVSKFGICVVIVFIVVCVIPYGWSWVRFVVAAFVIAVSFSTNVLSLSVSSVVAFVVICRSRSCCEVCCRYS